MVLLFEFGVSCGKIAVPKDANPYTPVAQRIRIGDDLISASADASADCPQIDILRFQYGHTQRNGEAVAIGLCGSYAGAFPFQGFPCV